MTMDATTTTTTAKLVPRYRVETRLGEYRAGFLDPVTALQWMRRFAGRGDRLRNCKTGRVLAKSPGGKAAVRPYSFLKDVERDNGNGKLHELGRDGGVTRRR